MKIIRWDHYDYDAEKNVQKEYRELDDPNPQETYMNLCEEIRKHGYKFDGPYHQTGKMGTPVLEGDLYMTFSYRSWGGVMADAWSCVDKVDYSYMDFYMMDHYSDEFKTPEYELPGFVKPERPIVRKPVTHLEELSIAGDYGRIHRAIDEYNESFKDIRGFRNVLKDKDKLKKFLEICREISNATSKLQDDLVNLEDAKNKFYRENPQFRPEGIVTLFSKDKTKSIRVYGKYADETYESVMEKYPVETCTDNQLESVFPDWNRFERAFGNLEDCD